MAEARERVFTATHGVYFTDDGQTAPWAAFTRDEGREELNGARVFSCTVTDAKVAERLLAVGAYGIAEVTG